MASSSIDERELQQMRGIMRDLTQAHSNSVTKAAVIQSALWPRELKHNNKKQDVLVLCSGGMDSITAVEFYRYNFKTVFMLSIYYGQRNVREIEFAKMHAIRRELNWA